MEKKNSKLVEDGSKILSREKVYLEWFYEHFVFKTNHINIL